jgi:hypothetical protein
MKNRYISEGYRVHLIVLNFSNAFHPLDLATRVK